MGTASSDGRSDRSCTRVVSLSLSLVSCTSCVRTRDYACCPVPSVSERPKNRNSLYVARQEAVALGLARFPARFPRHISSLSLSVSTHTHTQHKVVRSPEYRSPPGDSSRYAPRGHLLRRPAEGTTRAGRACLGRVIPDALPYAILARRLRRRATSRVFNVRSVQLTHTYNSARRITDFPATVDGAFMHKDEAALAAFGSRP